MHFHSISVTFNQTSTVHQSPCRAAKKTSFLNNVFKNGCGFMSLYFSLWQIINSPFSNMSLSEEELTSYHGNVGENSLLFH